MKIKDWHVKDQKTELDDVHKTFIMKSITEQLVIQKFQPDRQYNYE